MHAHHVASPIAGGLILLTGCGLLIYLALAVRYRVGGRSWSHWKLAAWLAGSSLLVLGLSPTWLPFAPGDFRNHMLQHLLVGMFAPLGLVLAAPMTLLLGTLPRRAARGLVRVLHSGFVRFVSHPVVALVLNVGGMGLLYFTPLHDLAASSPALQGWMQLHFLLAGYLFAWTIAGPDPAPGRPSVPYRLVVLGVAIFLHSSFSQLLYAGWFVQVDVPRAQRLGGAELMYYGGDIAELLLAFAMLSSWRPAPRPGTAFACRYSPREGVPP